MRLKLAVSQTECASKLGISQTHLSNIEHGRQRDHFADAVPGL